MEKEITITKKVATFIKEKRMALGMTQKEFADHVFDNTNKHDWISRIEMGRGITLTTVERIFSKIGANIDITEQ